MSEYVGLDVSLEGTSVCILDDSGGVTVERTVATDPESIARLIRAKARRVKRVGLETGQLSVWLCHELRRLGVPVVCMDARQAHAALSVRPVKTDQNDARGPPGRRVPMTAKVRVASTVQTAKGVEYIAASAPDTHHEATIDLGKNREPGWLRKSQKSLTQTAQLKNTPQSMKAASPSTGSATA